MKQDLSQLDSSSGDLIHTRLKLFEFAISNSLEDLLQKTLDEVGLLTESPIGFYHFVEKDQKTLSLQAWSTRTVKEFCKAEGKGMHYAINQAGVWVDCVHARKPVIHNDYISLQHKKGLPEGHAAIIRELVVPIMRAGSIVAILGVGNKPTDYTEKDMAIVSYLADIAWEIADHKRMEAALRQSEHNYRLLFNSMISGYAVHEIILNTAGTPVDYRFLSVNPAFEKMTGLRSTDIIGKTVREVIPDIEPIWIERYGYVALTGEHTSFESYSTSLDKTFEVNAFRPEPGKFATIFNDITERKRVTKERDKLIADLQKTLNEVKTLSGLLPICSHCKNIRDDKGYWDKIESYIHNHSDAEFSHGICPECAKKYYPDLNLYNE